MRHPRNADGFGRAHKGDIPQPHPNRRPGAKRTAGRPWRRIVAGSSAAATWPRQRCKISMVRGTWLSARCDMAPPCLLQKRPRPRGKDGKTALRIAQGCFVVPGRAVKRIPCRASAGGTGGCAIRYDTTSTHHKTGKSTPGSVMEFVRFKDYGGELGTRVVEGWAGTKGPDFERFETFDVR